MTTLHAGWIAALIILGTSCNSAMTGQVGYSTPFATFTIDTAGNVSVLPFASIVTPVGVFFVGAQASYDLTPDKGTLLIIRHRRDGKLVDEVFHIATNDEIVAI